LSCSAGSLLLTRRANSARWSALNALRRAVQAACSGLPR
jgi:hypothetical protein